MEPAIYTGRSKASVVGDGPGSPGSGGGAGKEEGRGWGAAGVWEVAEGPETDQEAGPRGLTDLADVGRPASTARKITSAAISRPRLCESRTMS
jgi:hypothetical protein